MKSVLGTASTILCLLFVVAGCGEATVNPEDVPAVSEETIKKELDRPEAKQYMVPPGGQQR